MSTTRHPSAGSRAKSCTACRQVKLACDARRQYPCTRCTSKSLECRFDANFKRIPTRKIAQEIANEIHTLRASQQRESSISSDTSKVLEAAIPRTKTSSPPLSQKGLQHDKPSRNTTAGTWLNTKESDGLLNYSLPGINLNPSAAVALFQHYEQHYLIHTPFLQPVESIAQLTTRSPLLFWTIILTASQYHNQYDWLYDQLYIPHEILLSQIVHNAIDSVEVVHSLLILCTWPVPKLREQHDPAWNYVGTAIHAAMQLECNKIDTRKGEVAAWRSMSSRRIDATTRAWTWLSCFETSMRIGNFNGLHTVFPMPQHMKSIDRALRELEGQIEDHHRARLDILKTSCASTAQLELISDHYAHFSLTQSFNHQFDSVKERDHDQWTAEAEIELQAAKLILFGLHLTLESPPASSVANQAFSYRQSVLQQGLRAASMLIHTMSDLGNSSLSEGYYPAGVLTFYPKSTLTSLFTAGAFLFRVLTTYTGITSDDRNLATKCLLDAHKIFQSFPDSRDATRAAIHIEMWGPIIQGNGASNMFPLEDLVVRDRLGASVVWDATFRSAQQRNRNYAHSSESPPVSNWISLNEDPSIRLPPAPEQKRGGLTPMANILLEQQTQQAASAWKDWDIHMDQFAVADESTWQSPSSSMGGLQSIMDQVGNVQIRHGALGSDGSGPPIFDTL